MPKRATVLKAEGASAPKRLSPGARKAQLLRHAIAAFAEAGIERAVHADVAARAQVSTPTVFKYFPTRDALVDAILSEVEDVFWDLGGIKSNAIQLDAIELARTLAEIISALCVSRPNLMKVALTWSFSFSSIRGRYQVFERVRLDDLQPAFKTAGLTRADARIFLSSILLYIRMHFDGTGGETRQLYINRLCEMLETSMSPKG